MVKSEVSESLQVTNYQFDLYILAYSKVYTKNIFYLYFYYCAIAIDAIKSGRFFALSCAIPVDTQRDKFTSQSIQTKIFMIFLPNTSCATFSLLCRVCCPPMRDLVPR